MGFTRIWFNAESGNVNVVRLSRTETQKMKVKIADINVAIFSGLNVS
jgi:hypothetical protein